MSYSEKNKDFLLTFQYQNGYFIIVKKSKSANFYVCGLFFVLYEARIYLKLVDAGFLFFV